MAQGGQLNGGQNTIATQPMGGGKDVAGLFSTEARATGHHGGMDVLISHRRAIEGAAPLLPGTLEAKVRHHSGHQPLIGERLLLLQHGSPEKQHVVAVDDAAAAVHRQHPIGITVKGKTHRRAALDHSPLQRFQMG